MTAPSLQELRNFDCSGITLTPPGTGDAQLFYDDRWLRAWAQAFLPAHGWARPLTVYSARTSDASLGFIAFAQQTIVRLPTRSLAGYYWPFRTVSVRDDDDSRRAFAASIADDFSRHPPATALRFGPVSSSDAGLGELLRALAKHGWTGLRRDGGPVFTLDLPDDAGVLEARVSKALLKNARYCQRRMEREFGGVSFQRHKLDAHADEVLDIVERIERASWVAREGGDLKFSGVANRKFWSALGSSPTPSADAIIWVLRCGEMPVAFSAHVETPETAYIIANGYDERWASHSPGSVLSLELLRDACQRGKKKIDWGQGDSGYKSRWGAVVSASLFDVVMFRPGVRGRILSMVARQFAAGWRLIECV